MKVFFISIKTLFSRISDVFWRKEYLWKSCKYMRILRKISNCKWESNVKNHYVISREIYLNNLCILSLMCSCQHAAYIMHFSELDGSTAAAGAVWRSLLSCHGKSPPPCRKWPNWIWYSYPAQLWIFVPYDFGFINPDWHELWKRKKMLIFSAT